MMYCTPRYTVSYKGVFYRAGKSFEIDGDDREEMARHGKIEELDNVPMESNEMPMEPDEPALLDEPVEEPETVQEPKPARKVGRPRKEVSNG